LKYEIKNLYKSLSEIKKEKEDLEYSKEIMENYEKYNLEEDKLMKKFTIVSKRIDKLTDTEFEKVSTLRKLLEVNIFILFIISK
jgi:hypothetical protein